MKSARKANNHQRVTHYRIIGDKSREPERTGLICLNDQSLKELRIPTGKDCEVLKSPGVATLGLSFLLLLSSLRWPSLRLLAVVVMIAGNVGAVEARGTWTL